MHNQESRKIARDIAKVEDILYREELRGEYKSVSYMNDLEREWRRLVDAWETITGEEWEW